MLEELERAKPASAKGRYIRRISLSSTMGPGIKIDPNRRDDDEPADRGRRPDPISAGHLAARYR